MARSPTAARADVRIDDGIYSTNDLDHIRSIDALPANSDEVELVAAEELLKVLTTTNELVQYTCGSRMTVVSTLSNLPG